MFKEIMANIFSPPLIFMYVVIGFFVFLVLENPPSEYGQCVIITKSTISQPVTIDIMERITKMCADVTLSRN